MARPRKTQVQSQTTGVSSPQGEEQHKMADRGSLTKLEMVEVTEEELAAATGGRGSGAYDNFIAEFLAEGIKGTGVEFDGVAAQSVKTGLKGAIARAVEAKKVAKDELQIRGKDGKVYLVKSAQVATATA